MAAVKKGDEVTVRAIVDRVLDNGRMEVRTLDADGEPAVKHPRRGPSGDYSYLPKGTAVFVAPAAKLTKLREDAEKLANDLDHIAAARDDRQREIARHRLGAEVNNGLRKLQQALIDNKGDAKTAAEQKLWRHLQLRVHDLTERVLTEIFMFNPEEAAQIVKDTPLQKTELEAPLGLQLPLIYVDCSFSLSGDQKLTYRAWAWASAFKERGCETWGFNDSALLTITSADDIRNLGGGGQLDHVIKHAAGRPAVVITDGMGLMVGGKMTASKGCRNLLPDNFKVVDIDKTPSPSRALIDNATMTTLTEPVNANQSDATPTETTMTRHDANIDANAPTIVIRNQFVGRDVAAYQIGFTGLGRTIEVEGSAKRQHDDEPNEEIGALLSLGRAFRQIGRELEDEGRALSEAACTQHVHPDMVAAINGSNEVARDVIDRGRHDKHVDHLNSVIERLQADAIATDERLHAQEVLLAKQKEALAAKPAARTRKAAAKKTTPAKPRTRTTAAAKRAAAK